jgi:hypothetical protein
LASTTGLAQTAAIKVKRWMILLMVVRLISGRSGHHRVVPSIAVPASDGIGLDRGVGYISGLPVVMRSTSGA